MIEAKKAGVTLSAVADQSGRYAENLPDFLRGNLVGKLPSSTNRLASKPAACCL